MATVNLDPTSTLNNNWTISLGGSGTVHQNLADTSDTSYIYTDGQDKTARVELVNSVEYLNKSIDSVRFYIRGVYSNTRSGNVDIQVILEDSSNTALYSETITLNFTAGYAPEDHYGTARTTTDGSTAWTDEKLDDLRLEINTDPEDPSGISEVTITRAHVEVTYTPAGYGNIVNGVAAASISEIDGVATAEIEKVIGV